MSDIAPPWMVTIGRLGVIDWRTKLLRSYDTGRQTIAAPYYQPYNYYFQLDAGLGQTLQGSIVTGQQYADTINVHVDENTVLGPLTGPLSRPLTSGEYFIKVTPGFNGALHHFGVVAVPPLSLFPNDAGRDSAAPRDLGELTRFIGRSNSFYTYFPRARVTMSDSPVSGPLVPDFGNPTPYAPSADWYRFSVSGNRRVRLSISGSRPGPTFVLHLDAGKKSIWGIGQTIDLARGSYLLSVYDQVTRVAGGGGGSIVIERDPRAENFERYAFELAVTA